MDLANLRKSIARELAAFRRLDAALKDAASLPEDLRTNPYEAAACADALHAALRELAPSDLRSALEVYHTHLTTRLSPALEDAAAKLAAAIANDLGKDAPLTGQLPELRWGLLRLEFKLSGPKREVGVWYGPRIERLAVAAPNAAEVAAVAREARAALDREPLDGDAFADELARAYDVTRRRLALESGAPAPLLQVLADLVAARQSASFLADPVAAHFRGYGRVQFSYDLYRAGSRAGIALGVAAHAQTKRPEDHLWVPQSASGEGTHFASLGVRGKVRA
jgi:hypothetical protein